VDGNDEVGVVNRDDDPHAPAAYNPDEPQSAFRIAIAMLGIRPYVLDIPLTQPQPSHSIASVPGEPHSS
jgi:hypothetical protein